MSRTLGAGAVRALIRLNQKLDQQPAHPADKVSRQVRRQIERKTRKLGR